MNGPDYEQLTLFPAASRANPSPKPDSAEARAMTATSGRRCLELSTSCGLLGSLERMLLTSSIWRSTMCFLTWKVKATPHGRLWFQLVASALRTKDTDLQSWPTPPAMAAAGLARPLQLNLYSSSKSPTTSSSRLASGSATSRLDWFRMAFSSVLRAMRPLPFVAASSACLRSK